MKTARLLLVGLILVAGPSLAQQIDPIGDLLSAPAQPPTDPPQTPAGPGGASANLTPVSIPPPAVDPAPPVVIAKPAEPELQPVEPRSAEPHGPQVSEPPSQAPASLTPPPEARPEPKPEPKSEPEPEPRPAPRPETPIHIDELGRTPDAPPTPSDLNYESRLRATYNAAQGMQGLLDGRWILRVNGLEAYQLQLVDKGQGTLEGAWRDPRRAGAVDSSGFIDEIQTAAGRLTIRFKPRRNSAETVNATLESGAPGQWSGEVTENGVRRPATLSRN